MASMPKILFNATDDEKKLWVVTAEGEAKNLSEWIRDTLNAAALVERPVVATGRGERREAAPRERVPSAGSTPAPRPGRSTSACPRERFHRKGAFCKACNTTP